MSTHTVGHNSPLFSTQWLYIGKWASWLRFSLWGSSRDDRVHKSILCVQKVENYVYPYYVCTYALAEFTLVVLSIILWIPHSPYFTFLAETWRKKRYTVRKQLMICLAHSSRLTCCLPLAKLLLPLLVDTTYGICVLCIHNSMLSPSSSWARQWSCYSISSQPPPTAATLKLCRRESKRKRKMFSK